LNAGQQLFPGAGQDYATSGGAFNSSAPAIAQPLTRVAAHIRELPPGELILHDSALTSTALPELANADFQAQLVDHDANLRACK